MLTPNINTGSYFIAKYFGGGSGQGSLAISNLPVINHNNLGYGESITSFESFPAGYIGEVTRSWSLNSTERSNVYGRALGRARF